jgi:hypothetical protein
VAFLVGLGAADRYAQAFGRLLDVGDVQRDQLGAPERPGEAKQQQGAVAQCNQPCGSAYRRHGDDALRGRGGFLEGRRPESAADAAHRCPDLLVIRRRRQGGVAPFSIPAGPRYNGAAITPARYGVAFNRRVIPCQASD